jgi:hypothetical protein
MRVMLVMPVAVVTSMLIAMSATVMRVVLVVATTVVSMLIAMSATVMSMMIAVAVMVMLVALAVAVAAIVVVVHRFMTARGMLVMIVVIAVAPFVPLSVGATISQHEAPPGSMRWSMGAGMCRTSLPRTMRTGMHRAIVHGTVRPIVHGAAGSIGPTRVVRTARASRGRTTRPTVGTTLGRSRRSGVALHVGSNVLLDSFGEPVNVVAQVIEVGSQSPELVGTLRWRRAVFLAPRFVSDRDVCQTDKRCPNDREHGEFHRSFPLQRKSSRLRARGGVRSA